VHRVLQKAKTAAALLLGAWTYVAGAQPATSAPLPEHLRETGLYVDGPGRQVSPKNISFSPQYPLWSDGAIKRRWIYLPPGTAIDATRPDAWEFPVGTRLWKEFSVGRPIETRYIERLADGTWRFATYIWNQDGTDATIARADGTVLEVPGAPKGSYSVPGEGDCRACHEGAATPVLGFSALQLSPDRDPLAPHADPRSDIDLSGLVSRGLIKNLPRRLISNPPRIAARSPEERAALGYLHGNCGHCHNDNGAPAPVDLTLAQSVSPGAASADRVLRTMINAPSRFRGHGLPGDAPLIAPGRPDASVLIARVRSRNPQTQMPPLGTQMLDADALALLQRWITEKTHSPEEFTL
jgi:hypothetical protein